MKHTDIEQIRAYASRSESIPEHLALEVLKSRPDEIMTLMSIAHELKVKHFGYKGRMCSIVNGKKGNCSEDCSFCAQSAHHKGVKIDTYPMKDNDFLNESYLEAASNRPIDRFGIVVALDSMNGKGVDKIRDYVTALPEDMKAKTKPCASLGTLSEDQLGQLKDAGLVRYHHNLETSESFFPSICSTHTYETRLKTVRAAKRVGLETCVGGILGMGETLEDRVEFAKILAREGVDSVPLNFLVAIEGTPLQGTQPMEPMEIIRAIVMFRLTNPTAEVKICAGRQHLRSLQSMVFFAGATGLMIGPLLTTPGARMEDDIQMLKDLGLDLEPEEASPLERQMAEANA